MDSLPPRLAADGPKQKRSVRSQEQILAAAERLLERDEYAEFTLLGLSRESGISVGGIYRHFVDKDGLVQVLQQRLSDRMLAEFRIFVDQSAQHGDDLKTRVSTLIAGLALTLKHHAPVLRKIVEASASNPVLAARGAAAYSAHLAMFRQELLNYRDTIRHEDPEYAIEFCFRVSNELIASHFGFGRPSTVHEPMWERLVDNLQRLCVSYLAGRD